MQSMVGREPPELAYLAGLLRAIAADLRRSLDEVRARGSGCGPDLSSAALQALTLSGVTATRFWVIAAASSSSSCEDEELDARPCGRAFLHARGAILTMPQCGDDAAPPTVKETRR